VGIVFAVRGDSLDARYSGGGKTPVSFLGTSTTIAVAADGGAIGGSLIQFSDTNNNQKFLVWPGRYNTPNGVNLSCLMRVKASHTGAPSARRSVMPTFSTGRSASIEVTQAITTGNIEFSAVTAAGATANTNTSFGAWSPTSGTYYDLGFSVDISGTTNAAKFYIDGVLLGTISLGAAVAASWDNTRFFEIMLGGGRLSNGIFRGDFNELVIWDSIIDFTANQTLTSGSGALNGASRTAFVDVAAFDGALYSNPGIANVRSGTSYSYAGASLTGTAAIPGASDVKTGVATDATTGTYDGSDRHTDPGESNVRSGTAYKSNSTTNNKTGTLAVPSAANVLDGVAVDAGTGTYDPPSTGEVKTGVTFGAAGAQTGTYDGSDRHTDPGEENVLDGVQYKSNSTSLNKTGTLVAGGDSTDPGVENVKLNVEYEFNGTPLVGEYDGSDRYDALDPEDVRFETEYLSAGVERTGELIGVPTDARSVTNAILRFIGQETLTDAEWATLDITTATPAADVYEELAGLLDARGATDATLERLRLYFEAKGVVIGSEPEREAGSTHIIIGSDLDDTTPSTQEGPSNVFLGGEL
jgi:hypothetical protein